MGYFVRGETRPLTSWCDLGGQGSAVATVSCRCRESRGDSLSFEAHQRGAGKQFTTLGENITALEVAGTFDDCQRLVKQAFSDES